MSKKGAAYRLRKEVAQLARDRPEMVWCTHRDSNILLWSFLLAPPDDSEYGGGWYWGRLSFPAEYPFAPPGIVMCTPSGRFATDVKICMSMSDFHPESWNPAWSVSTILKGVLSFMLEEELTTGAVRSPPAERRRLAAASAAWNASRPEFAELFPDFDAYRAAERARRSAPAPAPAPASKADGDAAFRAGDYAAAERAYTSALEADPRQPAALRNRAAAREKLGDDAGVIADASAALALDAEDGRPLNAKAALRRASANERLGKTAAAAADYRAAAATDPPNVAALRAKIAALEVDAPPPPPGADAAAAKKKKKKKKKKSGGATGAGAGATDDDDDAGDAS